jgi:hypothetical protein
MMLMPFGNEIALMKKMPSQNLISSVLKKVARAARAAAFTHVRQSVLKKVARPARAAAFIRLGQAGNFHFPGGGNVTSTLLLVPCTHALFAPGMITPPASQASMTDQSVLLPDQALRLSSSLA